MSIKPSNYFENTELWKVQFLLRKYGGQRCVLRSRKYLINCWQIQWQLSSKGTCQKQWANQRQILSSSYPIQTKVYINKWNVSSKDQKFNHQIKSYITRTKVWSKVLFKFNIKASEFEVHLIKDFLVLS